MLHLPDTRWHAFSWHLLFSVLIFVILFFVITLFWFPGVFMYMGGWQGVKIVAGVDLILGPLLTLLIYNKAKKGIKMDLCIIALFQLSCLTAGVYLVYQERPLVQIFGLDVVYVHGITDLEQYDISREDIANFSGSYPKKLYLDLPKDKTAVSAMDFSSSFVDGVSLDYRQDLYREMNEGSKSKLDWRYERLQKSEADNCRWVDIQSKYLRFDQKGCFSLSNGIRLLK
ncbi:MAG: hypothetical protein HRU20_15695 [Pseudomonadales bacterium]|nr:hypothetical protein [Pseudomonadales bacterium]